jgi:hypothetical protein
MSEAEQPDMSPVESVVEDDEGKARVLSYPQGWHLVERGTWQVSVAPDGLLMLPRHLHPDEIDDFCAAARAAAPVGRKQRAANEEKTTPQPTEEELLAQPSVFVTEAGAEEPAGTVRMMATPRAGTPQDRSAIGRPRRRDPREPLTPPAPQPPIPGGRHGRTQQ